MNLSSAQDLVKMLQTDNKAARSSEQPLEDLPIDSYLTGELGELHIRVIVNKIQRMRNSDLDTSLEDFLSQHELLCIQEINSLKADVGSLEAAYIDNPAELLHAYQSYVTVKELEREEADNLKREYSQLVERVREHCLAKHLHPQNL